MLILQEVTTLTNYDYWSALYARECYIQSRLQGAKSATEVLRTTFFHKENQLSAVSTEDLAVRIKA